MFLWLLVATVHPLANFETSSVKYSGPFWQTEPWTDLDKTTEMEPWNNLHASHPKTVPTRSSVATGGGGNKNSHKV